MERRGQLCRSSSGGVAAEPELMMDCLRMFDQVLRARRDPQVRRKRRRPGETTWQEEEVGQGQRSFAG